MMDAIADAACSMYVRKPYGYGQLGLNPCNLSGFFQRPLPDLAKPIEFPNLSFSSLGCIPMCLHPPGIFQHQPHLAGVVVGRRLYVNPKGNRDIVDDNLRSSGRAEARLRIL